MSTLPSCVPPIEPGISETFNRYCHCVTVDEKSLAQQIETAVAEPDLYRTLCESRPHLFSPIAVFVDRKDVERMRAVISAVDRVTQSAGYRSQVFGEADAAAQFDPGSPGAFLGFDFHLGPNGPQLIEINTNAGGALLNTVLARATRACCREVEAMVIGATDPVQLDTVFIEMFRREWHAQRGAAALRTIAIVDDEPAAQYLYPEFRMFEAMFQRHGLRAVIADPSTLVARDGKLYSGDLPIDLVYNRLTDFALTQPRHATLREAYLNNTVALTPHPHAYALYADKRNLTLLSDPSFLSSLNLPTETLTTLQQGIPQTVLVTPATASGFWEERRQWFFKPATGFGSRAAYRGDKLTKRVFEEISKGGYVAQRRVEPTERAHLEPTAEPLKFDIRCYVYAGEIQLLAARLYRGQTTNFRTPGGGFAPVFYTP